MGLLAAACTGAVPEAEPFEGVWASQGWGIILHIDGSHADLYETSATHCLLADAASARNIDEVVALEEGQLVLRDAGRVIRFDALFELPARCGAEVDASPQGVLAATVAAVEEHFQPGVDAGWPARKASAAATPLGDDAALAAAIVALLSPLDDPQIALQHDGTLWSLPPAGPAAEFTAAMLAGSLLPEALVAAEGGLVMTDLGAGVRYLGLLRLGGFAGGSDGSQRVLAAALDQSLRDATALVLDLRATTTGAEVEALLVATRFVSAPTLVATSSVRGSDGAQLYAGEATVHPMPTGAYAGRVIVLIGPGTAGPAELLAVALSALPNVTLVGEATAGSPRSPLVRTLPNGWVLGVPNTAVAAADGTKLVGTPLVPDVAAALTVDDVVAGRDPGLETALALLGEGTP